MTLFWIFMLRFCVVLFSKSRIFIPDLGDKRGYFSVRRFSVVAFGWLGVWIFTMVIILP